MRWDPEYQVYDIYEHERPYRWIDRVVWGIILFYLLGVWVLGIATTPVENDRPILFNSEERVMRKYIGKIDVYIYDIAKIEEELDNVIRSYRSYRIISNAEAANQVRRLTYQLMAIRNSLDRLTVPPRFSGVIPGLDKQSSAINTQAFHPQFEVALNLLIDRAQEVFQYFSDFDEQRWERVELLKSQFNERFYESTGIFQKIVSDLRS